MRNMKYPDWESHNWLKYDNIETYLRNIDSLFGYSFGYKQYNEGIKRLPIFHLFNLHHPAAFVLKKVLSSFNRNDIIFAV